MGEREIPMHPELDEALRAYEIEVLDGTERSQTAAYERLKAVRRRLGGAAVVAAPTEDELKSEQQLAS